MISRDGTACNCVLKRIELRIATTSKFRHKKNDTIHRAPRVLQAVVSCKYMTIMSQSGMKTVKPSVVGVSSQLQFLQ